MWGKATYTAVYLHNRSSAVTPIGPFEAWTTWRPNLDKIKIFSYDAYTNSGNIKKA